MSLKPLQLYNSNYNLVVLDNYDTAIIGTACGAIDQTIGVDMKVNLRRYSTRVELAKMAFWNLGNDFTTAKLDFEADIR